MIVGIRARIPTLVREVRRAVAWHRGLLAGGLAAASMAFALSALSPPPPVTVQVLAAARDLAAGSALASADVRALALPPPVVPAGALRPGAAVVGRLLAGPVRRGEALTDVRLVGPGLLSALGDTGSPRVAVPVRIADAGSVGLVRVADVIDVLAASSRSSEPSRDTSPTTPASATVVARGVPVLTVPDADRDGAGGGDGALVVVAASPEVAARLAAAAGSYRLSITLTAR